jgi:hypothetical protein
MAMLYMLIHVLVGVHHCQTNFCPGDRESDWVYEYTDDDGKRMVVVNGTHMTKEQYKSNTEDNK